MKACMKKLQHTKDAKLFLLPRLLAGGPLLVFSIMHFKNPEHLRNILTASGIPFVEINAFVATVTLLLAGLMLLSGFLSRIGGLLGVATMLPAIYSTVVLMRMTPENLPGGLTEVPFVPPMPLPVMVLITSVIVVFFGGGRLSVDWTMIRHSSTSESAEQ
jgi:uncharacterized membrane protein YphA (DoxX/SURF4 family)